MKRCLIVLLLFAIILSVSAQEVVNQKISVNAGDGHGKLCIRFTSGDKERTYTYRDLRSEKVTFYSSAIGFDPDAMEVWRFDDQVRLNVAMLKTPVLRMEDVPVEPLDADFKQILEGSSKSWRYSDWELYRWESFPGIFVIDFLSYNIQSTMLKRLSFFVEKKGFTGKIHTFRELSGKTDWNAHNYKSEDLAAFFTIAQNENVVLTSAEIYLRNTLVANGIIKKRESGYSGDGNTGLISLSQESPPYLRSLLLTHEGYHGLFYAANGLRELVYILWENLAPEAKTMWTDYLRTANAWNYDHENEYLLRNELLGYLMQQKDFGEYFDNTMFPRLLERNGGNAPFYEANKETACAAFLDMAGKIASFLSDKYNLSAGNLSYLRDVK